jgi:hypothetical protein
MVRIFATLMINLLSPMAWADVVFPPLTADDLNGRSLNLLARSSGKADHCLNRL